jgi:hypothetical protein
MKFAAIADVHGNCMRGLMVAVPKRKRGRSASRPVGYASAAPTHPARSSASRSPLHPLDFAVERYRFQFEMIAWYLTGFLISGIGFGRIVPANSRSAVVGACTAPIVTEELVADECDRNAAVAAMSNATTTNAKFNSRFMESLDSS